MAVGGGGGAGKDEVTAPIDPVSRPLGSAGGTIGATAFGGGTDGGFGVIGGGTDGGVGVNATPAFATTDSCIEGAAPIAVLIPGWADDPGPAPIAALADPLCIVDEAPPGPAPIACC